MTRNRCIFATGGVAAGDRCGAALPRPAAPTPTPITGAALDKAEGPPSPPPVAAVTETEAGDEESDYEVEVRLPTADRSTSRRDFTVLGTKTDGGDRPGDNDSD